MTYQERLQGPCVAEKIKKCLLIDVFCYFGYSTFKHPQVHAGQHICLNTRAIHLFDFENKHFHDYSSVRVLASDLKQVLRKSITPVGREEYFALLRW